MTIYYGCPETIEVNGEKVICDVNHASQYLQSPGPEFKHYGSVSLPLEESPVKDEEVVLTYLRVGWKKMKRVRVTEERTRPA